MVVLAAVDVEALPGDRPGQRRGQEYHRVRDLVGLGQPAQVGGCRGLVVDLLYLHAALSSLIGGIASALYTSASTRPNASCAAVTRCSAAAASARSVGTASPRRPSPAISLATSSSRAAVRAASTTSAPSRALASATDRPGPDPTPATTTTLSCSII